MNWYSKRIAIVLGACVVLCLGLLTGCDVEEAVDEATSQDFNEDADLELEPLEVEEGAQALVPAENPECGTTSVNAELDRAGVDLSDVDLDSIDLQYIQAAYRNASWTPTDITEITCTLTLSSDLGEVTVTETAVNGASSDWTDISPSDDVIDFVNYYLEHRDAPFSYCAGCSSEPDTFYLEYLVRIGVEVNGEISAD